jgi:hypothetical protein
MPRKNNAARNAVRQAKSDYSKARQRAQKLLQKANLDLREYRKQLKTLQKQQVISKRIITKLHKPTRYMVGKLKKFKGVAVGHELAVPAKSLTPHRQRLYTERGLGQIIDKFFVLPKTAERQRADIHKDHVRVTTSLEFGEETVVKFPTRLEDLNDFLSWADRNADTLNSLKGPRDQFGFQIFGHNAKRGFPNMQELIRYLNNYSHILDNHRSARNAIQEFILIKFRPMRRGTMHPTLEPYYGSKKYSPKRKRDKKDIQRAAAYKRENERKRKARYRVEESKEEHAKRLERQREYDRSRSNHRREERMAKKLMGD